MTGLNPRQLEAVRYTAGPLLVLAGAGSGKTRVITRKIAHLIDQGGISPRHICALTFTNKAAREMRERVGSRIKGAETRGLTISTFHTLGLDILRRHPERAGLRPRFSLLDAQDAEALIKEHLRHTKGGDAFSPAAIQHRISRWKNDLVDPAQAASHAEDDFEARLAASTPTTSAVCAPTMRSISTTSSWARHGCFAEHPELRETWQGRIRYLLVDEYQDTNGAQYDLVRQLVGPRGPLPWSATTTNPSTPGAARGPRTWPGCRPTTRI
jgi:ATP-dependent DNA helicase Rep